MLWYRDGGTWRFLGRYLACLAGLNLIWEIAQLPLYTIWSEAPLNKLAFAVAHCTVGDVLIGGGALLIAVLALRAPAFEHWNWIAVGCLPSLSVWPIPRSASGRTRRSAIAGSIRA